MNSRTCWALGCACVAAFILASGALAGAADKPGVKSATHGGDEKAEAGEKPTPKDEAPADKPNVKIGWTAEPPATGAPATAAATAAPEASATEEPIASTALPTSFAQVQMAVRSAYISDRGYDPFSTNDSLLMADFGLSHTLWHRDQWSFAPGLFWAYGAKSATARGDDTSLAIHRLGLGLEGRYHVCPYLYGYVRATPGVQNEAVSVNERLGSGELKDSHWLLSFDASAGAAMLLGPRGSRHRLVRFWVLAEGGYAWTERASLLLTAQTDADQSPSGGLRLGSLAIRGGFFRLGVAATY